MNSLHTTPLGAGASLVTLKGHHRGPVLALLGGVHGDEDDGVLAIRQVLRSLATVPLSGTIRTVAPANPAAFATHTRTSPLDGVNLARAFPGDPNGSPSAQLAAALTTDVIHGADLLVDLHSAGAHYDMPLFAGYVDHGPAADRAHQAALAFGTALIWVHEDCAAGRSLCVAHDADIPAIYVECSGGGGIRGQHHEAYVHGLMSVMQTLGMLPPGCAPSPVRNEAEYVTGGGDLDAGVLATDAGWFVTDTTAGASLDAGARVGRVFDFDARVRDEIHMAHAGRVMFLRRTARVQAGDVLFTSARNRVIRR